MSSNNMDNTVKKKEPEMIRKIIKMYMGTDDNPKSPNQSGIQCCLLCAIALDDHILAKKLMEMGANPIADTDPKHILMLQEFGYFKDI